MKKLLSCSLALIMLASCFVGMILPSAGSTANETNAISTVDESVYVMSDVRNRIPFNEDWKFIKEFVSGANEMKFNDSGWDTVSLPHSWTKEDYNIHHYYQGDAWYRKTFEVDAKSEYQKNNKRLWVEFEACGQYAQVYINGTLLGNHIGGYSAFRFDITDHLTDTGTNVIAIMASNSGRGGTIAPRGMDFDIWGGLYRDAWLIESSSIGVDMNDSGSSGFFLSAQKDADSDNWNFNVSSKIVNATSKKVTAEAEIVLRYPKRADLTWMDATYDISSTAAKEIGSDENPFLFDPNKMYETFENEDDYIVEKRTVPLTIAADGSAEVNEDFTVEDPKLWNGVYSPYRYVAEINVKVDGETVDHVKDFFGFRYYKIDDTGFYLNGEPYKLKGANKHQDFGLDENGEIIGFCTTARERYVDLCIAYEMGANYIRLGHYPNDKGFYELCDAYGICVSGELALGGSVGDGGTYGIKDSIPRKFFSGLEIQLTDLVKQMHNNPSIIIWSLANEVNEKYQEILEYYMPGLNDLAHELDGNNRYTSYTVCTEGQVGLPADLIAWNTYPQWYFDYTCEEFVANLYEDFKTNPIYEQYVGIAITEYGAGANPLHHTDVLERPATAGDWHPEEWANYVHESAMLALEDVSYLWVTTPWQLFDSTSAARNEGGLQGVNDKGLVNLDRTLKKDTFYLYKANYSEVPFVYFAENRFTPRDKNEITVKCYSNADSVKLYKMMNGEKTYLCDMLYQGAGIFLSPKLPLYFGDNEYIAEFEENGKTYTATCTFASTSDKTPTLPDIPETEPPKTETTAPDAPGVDNPIDESGAYRVTENGASINAAAYATWQENNLEPAENAAEIWLGGIAYGVQIVNDIRYGDVVTFKINVEKAGTYDLAYNFIWMSENSFSVSVDGGEAFTLKSEVLSPNTAVAVKSQSVNYDFTAGEHTITMTFNKEDSGCNLYTLDLVFVKELEEDTTTSTVEETTATPTEETTVAPVEETTVADATDAPAEETEVADATDAPDASGCKASVGATAAGAALLCTAGAVALKKKED